MVPSSRRTPRPDTAVDTDFGYDPDDVVTKPDNTALFRPEERPREPSEVIDYLRLRRPASGEPLAEAIFYGACSWKNARILMRAWSECLGPRDVLCVVRFTDGRGVEKLLDLDQPEGWK